MYTVFFFQLLNILAFPALFAAVFVVICKALWRGRLRMVGMARLWREVFVLGLLTHLLCWAVLGHDGSVWMYTAVVLVCSAWVWRRLEK